MNDPSTRIKLTNVTKRFGFGDAEQVALDNVNLEVKKGEFIAIVGPSGCGKTTLLNILGLLDHPSEGEYYLDNKSVAKLQGVRKHCRSGGVACPLSVRRHLHGRGERHYGSSRAIW